jgi:hypothetical protein
MNLAALIKADILSKGLQIDITKIKNYPDYKRELYAYNDSHHVPKSVKSLVPQEIIITHNGYSTTVSAIVYKDSPYLLTLDENFNPILKVKNGSQIPVKISFPKMPAYASMKTKDGIPMKRIINTCGLCELNVWLWHDCQYFVNGKNCKFCGINLVQKNHDTWDLMSIRRISNLSKYNFYKFLSRNMEKIASNVIECLNFAMRKDYKRHFHLIFTGGSASNEVIDREWIIYLELLKRIDKVKKLNHLDATIILTPPNDFKLIDRIAEFGVKFAFNLEVWDEKLFNLYCPGKAEYGRAKYMKAYKYAVSIAGENNVWGGFVLGLEPVESTLEGIEFLAQLGVSSGANVFHRDYGAVLQQHPVPSLPEIIYFYSRAAEIERSYGLKPFFCRNAMRTSLIHEAYERKLS